MADLTHTGPVTTDQAVDAAAVAKMREREAAKRRWYLLAPALLILLVGASGPLLIVLVYSFLQPGDYGGVVWAFSWEGWFNVFLQEDIFDETISYSDAHLSIFWRSVKLSFGTTVMALVIPQV